MELSPWIQELTEDQLPEPYKTLAAQFSVQTALRFAELYQGTGVYYPKLDSQLAEIRNKRIRAEFSGSNQRALAVKYGLTERWIYEILGSIPDDRQTTLFG